MDRRMSPPVASVHASSAIGERHSTRARHFYLTPIVVSLLSIWFFLTNPYFYSDAAWYAGIVRDRELILIESGHMGWRPLVSFILSTANSIGISFDPLQLFCAVSAFGTALLVLTTFALARRLVADPLVAWLAVAIVAFSNVCVSYGGSGSAYTPAIALSNVAILCLLGRQSPSSAKNDWSSRGGLLAVLGFVGAYLCWSLAILTLPLLWILAAQQAEGSLLRRTARASALVVSMVLATIIVAYGVYSFDPGRGDLSWWSWLRSSSHGIQMNVALINLFRATIGFVNGFVHTGDLGRSMKGIILGDSTLQEFESHAAQSVFALLFVGLSLIAVMGLWKRRADQLVKRLVLFTGAVLAPVALFAILWQGSDVERFCLAMPLVSISLATGLLAWGVFRVPLAILTVGLLFVANVVWFAGPILATEGGISMVLGAKANEELGDHGVVIITGQELDGPIVGNSFYYHRIVVINLASVARINGENGWSSYLATQIALAEEKGGKVAVLSDLVGIPTLGGIGLSQREVSHPSVEATSSYFAQWPSRHKWNVDRFHFLTLTGNPKVVESRNP